MDLLPLAFTSGWTSGINAYATVLILGLLGRFAGDVSVAGVTAFAVRNPVVAAVLVAVLLVAGIWVIITMMGRVRRGRVAIRRWMQPA